MTDCLHILKIKILLLILTVNGFKAIMVAVKHKRLVVSLRTRPLEWNGL